VVFQRVPFEHEIYLYFPVSDGRVVFPLLVLTQRRLHLLSDVREDVGPVERGDGAFDGAGLCFLTLSFVPALETMLLGLIAGDWLRSAARRIPFRKLLAAGAVGIFAGLALHYNSIAAYLMAETLRGHVESSLRIHLGPHIFVFLGAQTWSRWCAARRCFRCTGWCCSGCTGARSFSRSEFLA
jgi:hypothetical protein